MMPAAAFTSFTPRCRAATRHAVIHYYATPYTILVAAIVIILSLRCSLLHAPFFILRFLLSLLRAYAASFSSLIEMLRHAIYFHLIISDLMLLHGVAFSHCRRTMQRSSYC